MLADGQSHPTWMWAIALSATIVTAVTAACFCSSKGKCKRGTACEWKSTEGRKERRTQGTMYPSASARQDVVALQSSTSLSEPLEPLEDGCATMHSLREEPIDADNSLDERARGAPPGAGLQLPRETPTKRTNVPAAQYSPDGVDVSVDDLLRQVQHETPGVEPSGNSTVRMRSHIASTFLASAPASSAPQSRMSFARSREAILRVRNPPEPSTGLARGRAGGGERERCDSSESLDEDERRI